MRVILGGMVVAGASAMLVAGEAEPTAAPGRTANVSYNFNFDHDLVGKLPPSWVVRYTGTPPSPAMWEVVVDGSAPSLPRALSLIHTDSEGQTYNLLILYKPTPKDVDISVKLKAVSGKEDQGGGVMWRLKDEDNYYICRVNPLESNFRVYKVEKGKRTQLAGADVTAKKGKWYTVRAVMLENKITCYLDDQKLLEVTDDTFKEGLTGLWTKADAAAAFDDYNVKPAK